MDENETENDSYLASTEASMEDQTLDSDNEADEISEAFMCCVCLDLLYKPIVLACGHISCFWCVHRAMNALRESHCPVCRCPYNHFPSICQMLHFLLLKMYPVAYKRREIQVLEEEKKAGCFSPQFVDHSTISNINKELSVLVYPPSSSTFSSHIDLISDSSSVGKVKPCIIVDPSEVENASTIPEKHIIGNSEASKNVDVEENSMPKGDLINGTCKEVSVADLLCTACSQLLFRPTVLNCGHVFCESCLATPVDEMLRCQVCQSPHPKGFPRVCLELDHFLEEKFSKEYALRKDAVHLKHGHYQHESLSACATQAGKLGVQSLPSRTKDNLAWWREHGSRLHFGVGCDFCGMYPIIGERYKCKDCTEAIGFDLCGECYNTRSKLPGRFNQQHTPEHGFELVRLSKIGNIVLRLIQYEDGSVAPILSEDTYEDLEVGSPIPVLSVGTPDGPEDGSSTIIPSDTVPEDSEGTHSMI